MAASTSTPSVKLWGGRFTGGTDPLMHQFNLSLSYDRKLYKHDVLNSKAYSLALSKTDPPILSEDEVKLIHSGLDQVLQEWESNTFEVDDENDEDIHTANERRLSELIGKEVGGKVHTGRSRNDQVATDVRMWLAEEVERIITWVKELVAIILSRAEKEIDVLMPGYTHLQRAQPIRWSHFLLSHAHSFVQDLQRLRDFLPRILTLPLGSGPMAGNPFKVDTELLAKELGFTNGGPGNSMQAVSDRSFIAEFLFVCTLLMTDISKLAEDLIIYSTAEFGFVQVGDAYSTGSSIMPQKKNPDSLELLRGKTGRVFGGLSALLMTLKGVPSTYNKDLQEDKEPMFDAADTVGKSLRILQGVLSTMTINAEKMRAALTPDMLATDLAEYLVRKGLPFRQTHHISGRCVALGESHSIPLSSLTLEQLQSISPLFEQDVLEDVFDYEKCVERRDGQGGTSRRSCREQIGRLGEVIGIKV